MRLLTIVKFLSPVMGWICFCLVYRFVSFLHFSLFLENFRGFISSSIKCVKPTSTCSTHYWIWFDLLRFKCAMLYKTFTLCCNICVDPLIHFASTSFLTNFPSFHPLVICDSNFRFVIVICSSHKEVTLAVTTSAVASVSFHFWCWLNRSFVT